ncbi:MAG: prenyltransferase, partial [Methanothermobacter sp.]|nr:prenyltransferase [Methanothermobacter sp.]
MKTILEYMGFLFRISRFRFWIYTGGTYVIGYTLAASGFADFLSPAYYLYLIYFFFPASIFIYGVNDWWDEETDILNPKKGS